MTEVGAGEGSVSIVAWAGYIESGETIEVQQAFTDATLTELAHPNDGVVRAVKKVFQPVGVTFKGSGFYRTDSAPKSDSSGD